MQRTNHGYKLQSAMEYLMAYGWAILIIAVVMVALFALGVFNSSNFAPRASAGACQIVRNVESTTLQGQCQGELPRYVAVFDGKNSKVSIPSSGSINPANITIAAWIDAVSVPSSTVRILGKESSISTNEYDMFHSSTALGARLTTTSGSGYYQTPSPVAINEWQFGTVTYQSSTNTIAVYLNGALLGKSSTSIKGALNGSANPLYIGYGGPVYPTYFDGYLSNIQIYNTTLSANQIKELYTEGIGGAPIDPLHVVGWWPFNGNARDYSGNSNNGQATGVSYTSAWTSGYTQP